MTTSSLTHRGRVVASTAGVLAFLLVMAFVGGIEAGTIAAATALKVILALVAGGLGLVVGGPRWAAMTAGLAIMLLAVV